MKINRVMQGLQGEAGRMQETSRGMRCACCGSSAVHRYLVSKAGEVLRCRCCRLVFRCPGNGPDRLEELYSSAYFKEREDYFFKDGVIDGTGAESPHIEDFRAGLDLIEADARRRGKLLDVGCATGTFLRLAQQRGWQGYGVELSAFAAAVARETFGLKVICGNFSDAVYPDGFFDVVTMWDIIEHFPEPHEALAKARRVLRTSGLLLLNTPNESSLTRRVSKFLYKGSGGLIKFPVNKLYHRYHFSYFCASTLSLLFERTGFDVIHTRSKPIPLSRGRISPAEKVLIRTLSVAERLLHAEYELLFVARKRR